MWLSIQQHQKKKHNYIKFNNLNNWEKQYWLQLIPNNLNFCMCIVWYQLLLLCYDNIHCSRYVHYYVSRQRYSEVYIWAPDYALDYPRWRDDWRHYMLQYGRLMFLMSISRLLRLRRVNLPEDRAWTGFTSEMFALFRIFFALSCGRWRLLWAWVWMGLIEGVWLTPPSSSESLVRSTTIGDPSSVLTLSSSWGISLAKSCGDERVIILINTIIALTMAVLFLWLLEQSI